MAVEVTISPESGTGRQQHDGHKQHNNSKYSFFHNVFRLSRFCLLYSALTAS